MVHPTSIPEFGSPHNHMIFPIFDAYPRLRCLHPHFFLHPRVPEALKNAGSMEVSGYKQTVLTGPPNFSKRHERPKMS